MRVPDPPRYASQHGWHPMLSVCILCVACLAPHPALAAAVRDGTGPSPTASTLRIGPFVFYRHSQDNEPALPKPQFPAELMGTPVTDGYALVAWTIQPDGLVDDALVIETSDRAFGESALRALPRRLLPQRNADALPRYEMARFMFKRTHAVASMTAHEYLTLQRTPVRYEGRSIGTVQASELDVEVMRLGGPSGGSDVLQTTTGAGMATIRFYIDQNGTVRVPAILAASSPQAGIEALAAIRHWRFRRPTVNGNPVQVEATRTVHLLRNL